jgi:uracil-DNA glycosylase
MPVSGNLERWASQGVLLLNSVLTVRAHKPGSHQNRGWEQFTDAVIKRVNESDKRVVFMLWGAYALKKGASIDRTRHLVLESVHPSPLSAHRGFFGNHHFSRCNRFLEENGIRAIDWH